MNEFEKKLREELKEQGAGDVELESLVMLKNKLVKAADFKRSDSFKKNFLRRLQEEEKRSYRFVFPTRYLTPVLVLILLVIIAGAGVANAQKSLPGHPLYPVKILSENIIKTVNPAFKDEILERRSEEIKTITEQEKDSEQLNKTIDKYENDLDGNKNVNPTKIQESRKNLEDAKENSEDEEKDRIDEVIKKTEIKISEIHKEDEKENKKSSESGENKDSNKDHGENKNGENNGENNKD